MSDRWTDSLSDYLDEDLELPRRRELEAHLRECDECAGTLTALRQVVTRARALPEDRLAADLWPGIEARIGSRTGAATLPGARSWFERRLSFSMTQLAAACLAIAVLSGAAVWYARTTGRREAGSLIPGSASTSLAQPAGSNPGATSAAVEDLRLALANGREDLDPATVRTLEESLTVIEIAIREARRALDADPRNPYVREHLDETMRRRVELLHRATMLASASR